MRPCPAHGGNAFARFNSKAVYKDNVQSYTTTEPAIDLTASSMLAFSWQIASAAPLSGEATLARGLAAPPWSANLGGGARRRAGCVLRTVRTGGDAPHQADRAPL